MDWEVECPECKEFWTMCPCCGVEFCPNCHMTIEEASMVIEEMTGEE